jgi:prepilin-type N-terminal cleavage/methylation domain-containing protein
MRHKAAGFTLIELLIALGLMAIFALLAYRGLDSVLRLNSAAQTHDAQAAARLRVITQLEADLRQAHSVSIGAASGAGQTLQPSLQLKRRSVDVDGASTTSEVVWALDKGNLTRSVAGAAEPVTLLAQVTQLEWLVHQTTPVPSSNPWIAASLAAPAAGAATNDAPVRRAVMLHLTHQGLALEKAFLIGR